MNITLKDLRARFPHYKVERTVGDNFVLTPKGVKGPGHEYAFVTRQNTKEKCCASVYLYPRKGGQRVKLAETASYKSWHALKKEMLRNGAKTRDITDDALKRHMSVVLEDDMNEMFDVLEAHMSDVLYNQDWQHAYLVNKNRARFGYSNLDIARRRESEFGNDVEGSVSSPETESAETVVTVDPDRAKFLAAFTKGVRKVKLFDSVDLDLALCIRAAVALHEKAYDHVAANAESERVEAENKAKREDAEKRGVELGLSDMTWGFYDKFQRITIREAVEATVPPQLVQPVYLLISYTWNESLDWANEIIAAKRG